MQIKTKILAWILQGAWESPGIRRKIVVDRIAQEVNKMASWRTTVFGILAAAGTGLLAVKDPAWVATLGQIMAAIGAAGVGLSARDNKVSSEQAGIK